MQPKTEQSVRVRNFVRKHYKKLGVHRIRNMLEKAGIRRSISCIRRVASEEQIKRRDPKDAEIVERVIRETYPSEGKKGVRKILKEQHNINRTEQTIVMLAHNFGVKQKRVYATSPQTDVIRNAIKEHYAELHSDGVQKYLKEHHGITRSIGRIEALASQMRQRVKQKRSGAAEKSLKNWWLLMPKDRKKEFQDKFLADFRSNCRDPRNINEELLKRWPEAINEKGLKYAACALGETRNRLEIASEIKTIPQLEKMIEERIGTLIQNWYLKNQGADALYEEIRREFAKEIKQAQFVFEKEHFFTVLDRIVWTEGKNGTRTMLEDFIEKNFLKSPANTINIFREYHKHIPLEMIQREAKKITGVTNVKNPPPFSSASFVTGIGRLLGGEDVQTKQLTEFRLPEISFNQPYEVSFRDPKNFGMIVISGASLGILHTPRIEQNTTRRALSYAKKHGYEKIILTGLFDLDTTKAVGAVKGTRALYSGRNTNVDVLDPGYQTEARRIMEAIEVNKFTSEIIYETAKEGLMNLLRGWWKVALFKKTLEFPGEVLVVLGPKEFDIITAAMHAEILYSTLCKQEEIRAEIPAAKSAERRAEKQIKALEELLARLELNLSQTDNQGEQKNLRDEIHALRQQIEESGQEQILFKQRFTELKKQEARTRMTNVRPEDWQRFYEMALALVVHLIERAIPNSKVISLGTTYIKVGPKPKDKIKIVIPGHLKVTDRLLSDYTNMYAIEALTMEMAETIIICHPHAIAHAMTAREADAMGRRGYAPRIHVAPICIDGKFLRLKTGQIIRKSHPLGQVVNHPLFQGGILEITATDGMINASPVTIETLGDYERKAKLPVKSNPLADKYIWVMAATDQHWGGRAKEFLYDREQGKSLGMAEAAFHLMRKAGYGDGKKLPPFHMFVVNDDPTQGHHFPAEKEPHRHEMPHDQFEQELHNLREQIRVEKNLRMREALIDRMEAFSRRQVRVRGTDSYTRQMLSFIRCHVKENIDMFSGMLLRSHHAGLVLKPVSEFEDFLEVPFDTCDLGLDNDGTGNHGLGTTEDNLSEGAIFAEVKKAYLMTRPYWNDKTELLDRYVKGPVFGNKFIAFGTLKAPGGYEYAFDLRNTPAANGVDWGDPVRVGARVGLRRGNYSRMFENKFIVKAYGDKHFLATLLTSLWLEFMAPAGTHTDAYGERGFPPNNSGVAFLGLPAEGPASGPILIRPLLVHHLRDYIEENPRSFPWESFLPNPL